MSLDNLLPMLVGLMSAIPVVGGILAKIIMIAAPLTVAVTALVALWHALVVFVSALAVMPGLEGLKTISEKLKASEEQATGFVHNYILPILNRLSMIPIPEKK